MLTPIGLLFNFVGSIVLLGSDLAVVADGIKRIDPVHHFYTRGMRKIASQSMGERDEDDNRAFPYDNITSANQLELRPLMHFLNRRAEQDIPRTAAIDIRGGWFKINGTQLTLKQKDEAGKRHTRERVVELPRGGSLHTDKITLHSIPGLIYEARMRRVYIYGVSLLALGFFLQLVALVL